ncbi:MAG: bifunctional hydroxymethylpyrimidine kinase/phosphomethylpyrimidine kinase [Alphaproteobacteria bacterium]|nr:bifunctional hydroxymethylpyrimidine kinase/phosphomethylpyrimidine kinase [Alphaproteobacteria bacterium]
MTGLTPPTRTAGRVLIVGPSYASGTTGIQAAIKSAGALGAFAAAAVTSVIADETAMPVLIPPASIAAQMRAVLADIGADVLAIDGLAGEAQIQAVADILEGEARGIPVVLGLAAPADEAKTLLAPLARLVVVPGDADTRATASALATRGLAVLATSAGGNVLAEGGTVTAFPARRGTDRPIRGAGPSLAAAIAAGLAQGLSLAAAARRGRDYVEEAILTAPDFGRGAAPLNHVHTCRPTPPASFE